MIGRPMRVVVTGFDARSARPTVGEQRLSMAFLIAEAFRLWGHEVQAELCHPNSQSDGGSACADFYDNADLIFVGLASPVGLTSTYANHALLVLGRYWDDSRLRLFIDDPDWNKIIYGARSACRNETVNDPLFARQIFRNRYLSDLLTTDDRTQIYRSCARLAVREEWPTTFIPVQKLWLGHTLSDVGTGVDLTQIAVETIPWLGPCYQAERVGWLTEPQRRAQWAQTIQIRGLRMNLGNQPVSERHLGYRTAVGVLQSAPAGPKAVGWWTPAATLATRTNTFFATDLSRLDLAGIEHSAYYVLPAAFEDMSPAEREHIVEMQGIELLTSSTEIDDLVKELTS